jgi:hypothetical protein
VIDVDAIHRAASALGPEGFAERLGLEIGRQRLREGVLVCCPVHAERRPSCSLAERDGRIVWHCHACHEGGDAITLVAALEGLDHRRKFRRVAERAAEILGVTLEGGPRPARRRRRADPAVSLAMTIDRLAGEWLSGRDITRTEERPWPRAEDERVIAAASHDEIAEAFADLRELDAMRAERHHELERLADEYEART